MISCSASSTGGSCHPHSPPGWVDWLRGWRDSCPGHCGVYSSDTDLMQVPECMQASCKDQTAFLIPRSLTPTAWSHLPSHLLSWTLLCAQNAQSWAHEACLLHTLRLGLHGPPGSPGEPSRPWSTAEVCFVLRPLGRSHMATRGHPDRTSHLGPDPSSMPPSASYLVSMTFRILLSTFGFASS